MTETLHVIQYRKLREDVELPTCAYGNPAGLDIAAYCISESGRSIQAVIPPKTSRVLSTGLVLLPPTGFFLMVCSRSGMAAQTPPLFVANAPGIIDPDYTGELKVIVYNGGHESAYIRHGQKIAQIVLARHFTPVLTAATEIPETARGSKGFGSSDNQGG